MLNGALYLSIRQLSCMTGSFGVCMQRGENFVKLEKKYIFQIFCVFSPLRMLISLLNLRIGRSCIFANFMLIKFLIGWHEFGQNIRAKSGRPPLQDEFANIISSKKLIIYQNPTSHKIPNRASNSHTLVI